MAAARLAWRLNRGQLLFVTVVVGGLSAAALWLAFDMRSELVGCGTPTASEACTYVFPFQESHGGAVLMLQMIAGVVPYGLGLALGVPLVSGEVEHRTALIAWSLAGSRLRWLLWRAIPVLLIGFVLAAFMAFAAEQMDQAYLPKSDLGFLLFDARGAPLVMRAVVAFALAVALGALLGRLLPALLVGIALSVAVSIGFESIRNRWLPPAELDPAMTPFEGGNPMTTEILYRLPDGTVVGNEEGEALIEQAYEANNFEEPDPATMPQPVFYGIGADRYADVVLRESLALGAIATGMGAAAFVVVRRRRPE